MYIGLKEILGVLVVVALLYIIYVLINLSKLIKNIDKLVEKDSTNISYTVSKLPTVIDNFENISVSMGDIIDVVTDITSDAVVAKESIKSNMDIASEIINIIKNIFK